MSQPNTMKTLNDIADFNEIFPDATPQQKYWMAEYGSIMKDRGIAETLTQKDAEVAEKREEIVGHGYRMAVRHLKEAYKHNGATTVPEAIDWLEDNARLFPTPKD